MSLTSEHFMTAAKITLLILLLVQAARVWDAIRLHLDKIQRARAIAKIRRERENRHRQIFWDWSLMVATEPAITRRISQREWILAAPGIEREMSRLEQFDEAVRRG